MIMMTDADDDGEDGDEDNDKQMTMGVTDNIIAALKTNLSYARH